MSAQLKSTHIKRQSMPKRMTQNIYREKLKEAMIYFAKNVSKPQKTTMYKMLAELDFRHFSETGLPVTNLEYAAFRWGPVPKEFHEEITKGKDTILPEDIASDLSCEKSTYETRDGQEKMKFTYIAKRKPNLDIFTPREQKILKEVSDIYRISSASLASQASHEIGKPWDKTVKTKGEGATIDMVETIEMQIPISKEMARERLEEMRALIYNYA